MVSSKNIPAKRSSITFLQIAILLLAIGTIILMLWEPHLEGRNVNASLFEIYFNDPFLVYAYIASLPFFVALYQAFILLGYIRNNNVFSQAAINNLRTIKYCAIILIGFILGAEAYFFIVTRGQDDIAGGVMLGLGMIFLSFVLAVTSAVFETILRRAVDIKSENNLTV
ncbi:MAG: DUF2975 domain-containing protein [Candidatus Saccharimonadales bacterium]